HFPCSLSLFLFSIRQHPRSPFFPYTTLFRSEAIHHTSGRRAFQKPLISQPLMQNVIVDLALEVEAATLLGFRLARAVDDEEAGEDRKSTRLNSSHLGISYAVFCSKKKR